MTKFFSRVREVFAGDRGASALEYALLVGLIAVVIIAAVTLLGSQLQTMFGSVTTALQ